jgi:hypothetical protein
VKRNYETNLASLIVITFQQFMQRDIGKISVKIGGVEGRLLYGRGVPCLRGEESAEALCGGGAQDQDGRPDKRGKSSGEREGGKWEEKVQGRLKGYGEGFGEGTEDEGERKGKR